MPSPELVGTQACSDTVRLELGEQRWAGAPKNLRGVLSASERQMQFTGLPAEVVVEWEADVYQQGEAEPRPRMSRGQVDVWWAGRLSGQRLRHAETVYLYCRGRQTVELGLQREMRVRISTDPDSVSVYRLHSRYGEPRFIGTTPLAPIIMVPPRSSGQWWFQLQKSGFRPDTLVIRRAHEDEVFRRVLHPLPHTVPPRSR